MTISRSEAADGGARLAAQLEEVNDQVIAAVEACTDEEWRRPTGAEGWPVAVVAHHVAEVQHFFARTLAALATAEFTPATLTSDAVEENNRRHAREHSEVGKAETLALLRTAGPTLVSLLRGLDDDQLDRAAVVFDGQPLTVAQVAEFALVAHIGEHLASIHTTVSH